MLSRSRSKESECLETRCWLRPTEKSFDCFHQFVDPEGLSEVLNAGRSEEPLGLGIHHIPRYKQEPVAQFRIQGFNQPVQPLSADTGHTLIANDDVVILFLDLFERFRAGVGEIDPGALSSENIENQLRDMDLIVDDENLLAADALPLRCKYRLNFFGF